MTKVLNGFPPNYFEIRSKFNIAGLGVIISYGDRIFKPPHVQLTPALMAHEEAHCVRQREMGVEAWWRKYIDDKRFRRDEEIIGHRAEYGCYRGLQPEQKDKVLTRVAAKLCHQMYGLGLSIAEARKLIAEP